MGGARLKATGRCVFAMLVTRAISFNEYWSNSEYLDKKPVRNGSNRMLVGDNIYFYDSAQCRWHQADSHHSNLDGTANLHNVLNDTKADRVLISRQFVYFGRQAPVVQPGVLASIGFCNGRNYRVFGQEKCTGLLAWLHDASGRSMNCVLADPFDFADSAKRYSAGDNKLR